MRMTLPTVMLLATLLLAGCGDVPFTMQASGPFIYMAGYPAAENPRLERAAILVTITNRAGDDLVVSPDEFVARDSKRRIYPANPAATASDWRLVRVAVGSHGGEEARPLPAITLRQNDVLTGYVVFDLPTGVRPVDIIWRQIDGDQVVQLPPED